MLEVLENRLAPIGTFSGGLAATFSIADNSVIEPAPNGTVNLDFTVTRVGDLTSQVTVGYTTVAGTAQPNTDFTPTTGVTTFASGSPTATIAVPIFGNGVYNNPSLTFSVQLTGVVNVVGPPVTLAAPSDFGVGTKPFSVAVGDLNGDGKPDLVVANYGSNTVSVLLNTTPIGSTTPTFAPPAPFAAGTKPRSVAVADLNGDGKLDLIMADYGSNTASVLLNTTPTGANTPTFAALASFGTGTKPFSLAVADLNGDGQPDLVVANAGSDYVSVLLNITPPGAAAPSFASKVDFTTGSGPISVAIGDLNGDGLPDLAVANFDDNDVSVLLNRTAPAASTPSFASQATFAVGTGPRSVAVGDLNGDGMPDIVTANQNANSASVLLNTTITGAASPSFAPKVDFAAGMKPEFASIADLNGDGKPDLVVVNNYTGSNSTASVLLNTTAAGATAPSFATQQAFATGANSVAVAAADVNGDGQRDLVVVNYFSNNVSVLLNTTVIGAATIVPDFLQAGKAALGSEPISVAVADLNDDGKPDIAVTNFAGATISVLLNTTAPGAAAAAFSAQQTFAVGQLPESVAIGDVNGDGKPDLVVANYFYTANNVSVLLNTTPPGATTASFAPQATFATGMNPESVAIADLNGDGMPDVVAANEGSNSVSVLQNTTPTGAAAPMFASKVDFPTGASPLSVAIGDLNGDGKPDLVVVNSISDSVSVLLNMTMAGAPAPNFASQAAYSTGTNPYSVAIGDLNGDGKPDIVVANKDDGTVSVLLNKTTPGAAAPTFANQMTFAVGTSPNSVAISDLNGDGKPDLVIANLGANSASVLLNTTPPGAAAPSFAAQAAFAVGSQPASVAVADFNGDGRPDFAVANYGDGNASVLLNTPETIQRAAAVGTITESDPPPAVQFAAASQSVNASAGAFSITVTLSAVSGLNTTIPFMLGGTAVNGTDYSGVTTSPLIIPAGQTVGVITGTLLIAVGPNKTLTFTLGTPTNATVGANNTDTLTITEPPPPPPPPPQQHLPPSVSAAFGPSGEVIELVNSVGAWTQFDASGAHQLSTNGVRYASVAFGPAGEVLLVTYANGALYQFDAAGAHVLGGSGVLSASVSFGSIGEVVEVVNTVGLLTQFDAAGAHVLGDGVQSASVAFGPVGEALEIVNSAGALTQVDATGAHLLGASGVQSASGAFVDNSLVLDIIFSDGTLDQFDAFGVHMFGKVF